ncbi:hypothetical protein PUND_a0748 [Pseudoalteromonas undina]|nr:hypothetical protein PUND_a0748 [Pseudoalteromonas undina]
MLICIVHSCILLITLVKDTVNNLLASYVGYTLYFLLTEQAN